MPLNLRINYAQTAETKLSMRSRTDLLGINRSTLYYKPRAKKNIESTVHIAKYIADIHADRPILGYRKVTEILKREHNLLLNKKRVYGIMKTLRLRGLVPKRNLSLNKTGEYRYPYLLAESPPQKPNDAWAIDITYIKMSVGYVYLHAILDIYSRYIVGYYLSTTLDTQSTLKALESALSSGMKPAILNSDQGVQFTSALWVQSLETNQIAISMDGKGRYQDNIYIERFWRSIKYEVLFLYSRDDVLQISKIIDDYMVWYNTKRPHQGLNHATPSEIYFQKPEKLAVASPSRRGGLHELSP